MKFERDYLIDTLGLPHDPIEEVTIESDEIYGHRRWSVDHELIFTFKGGKSYSVCYSVAATESQDESPWEYEDIVEATEVKKVPVTTYEWRPVENES